MKRKSVHWTKVASTFRKKFGLSWKDSIQSYQNLKLIQSRPPRLTDFKKHPVLTKRSVALTAELRAVQKRAEKQVTNSGRMSKVTLGKLRSIMKRINYTVPNPWTIFREVYGRGKGRGK